ncbi:MAG TPA: Ig domain-containing protein [Candidatus Methylacidiphilales bacterium]
MSKKQLVGRAKLKGRLPAGVHFNAGTGAFTGTPHRKGVFRVMITATYRKVAGEGASGRYTSKAILRIRK